MFIFFTTLMNISINHLRLKKKKVELVVVSFIYYSLTNKYLFLQQKKKLSAKYFNLINIIRLHVLFFFIFAV